MQLEVDLDIPSIPGMCSRREAVSAQLGSLVCSLFPVCFRCSRSSFVQESECVSWSV